MLFLHSTIENVKVRREKQNKKNRAHQSSSYTGAPAVHVRDVIASRQAKIGRFDKGFAFTDIVMIESAAVGDNEILGLDIIIKDRRVVTT